MSNILIYHHLGLGDHFMCHGIVREYCKKYSKVGLFCHHHNFESVSFMFRDLKNLSIIKGDDTLAKKYIENNKNSKEYDEIKIIGYENLDRNSGEKLEVQFYKIAGVDLNKIWEGFYVERDFDREKAIFEKFAPKNEYVFLHDDQERDFAINEKKLDPKYEIFRPNPNITSNVFDYLMIIEGAKEVHVIDSSFMFMIDCLPEKENYPKLFIHRYSRANPNWKLPILKKNWHIFRIESYKPQDIYKFLKLGFYNLKENLKYN